MYICIEREKERETCSWAICSCGEAGPPSPRSAAICFE